jgi:hypothetical protein
MRRVRGPPTRSIVPPTGANRIPAFQFKWLSGAGVQSDDSEAVGRAIARFRDADQTKFMIQIPPAPYADRVASRAKSEGLIVHRSLKQRAQLGILPKRARRPENWSL